MDDQVQLGRANEQRVAVIGGGLAGLTAAIFAAKAGARVTLYEGGKQLGGRAQTSVDQGFHFNMGAHAFYRDGEAAKTFKALGLKPSGGVPELIGQSLTSFKGFHELPFSLGAIWRTSYLSLMDRMALTRLMMRLSKLDPAPYDHTNAEDMVAELAPRPRVAAYLMSMVRLATYANAPKLISGGAVLRQLQMGNGGVLYLDGGWSQLVESLTEIAVVAGVDIKEGVKIKGLRRESPVYILEAQKGDEIQVEAVVLAVSPKQAAALAGGLLPDLKQKLDQAVPVRAACLDVATNHVPQPDVSFALGVDEPIYFSLHSGVAKLAPEGGGLMHVAKYLPPESKQDAASLEEELTAYANLCQPGWKDTVIKRYVRPSMIVSNWLPLAAQGGYAGRPSVQTGMPGLMLAGDWVGSHGMLADAAAASGRLAGEHASASLLATEH